MGDAGPRRTFKIWEEGKAPDVVFEVTSKSTRRKDTIFKPRVFAHIGVKEYFLYDPGAEYLTPPLQGYRLQQEGYTAIQADIAGGLACEQLDLRLCLDAGQLQIYDSHPGELLQTESEAEQAARKAEQAAHQAERAAREVAEKRAAETEAELERLRARLEALERNDRHN